MIMIEKGIRKNLLIKKKVTTFTKPKTILPEKMVITTLSASDVLV